MSLNLTVEKDILPAIAGCARAACTIGEHDYAAGLWRSTFSRDLMWYNAEQPRDTKERPKDWTASSWSWASVRTGQKIVLFQPGRIASGRSADQEFFATEAIKTLKIEQTTGGDPFGRIESAHFRADAQLFLCSTRRFCTSQGRYSRTNRRDDLMFLKSYFRPRCDTDCTGLDVYDATVSTHFDIRFKTELNYSPIQACSWGCGTASVYLLRVLQRHTKTGVANYFMILNKREEQSSTYERIGVVLLDWEDVARSAKWFEEIWTPSVSVLQEIIMV
ncbi:hypothetical protein EJ04DRAFT_562808 [Polyplosphaeria fusca]|uniref:Uncharacterized protein n=1 Tax=Polyplosphaeria fusca TaxID=682080 RepID=A0A9P4R3D0_9PLEO|nr:hypothetical protein EJ04DRAFT_562808 [Polyplosphaeria fusca]